MSYIYDRRDIQYLKVVRKNNSLHDCHTLLSGHDFHTNSQTLLNGGERQNVI